MAQPSVLITPLPFIPVQGGLRLEFLCGSGAPVWIWSPCLDPESLDAPLAQSWLVLLPDPPQIWLQFVLALSSSSSPKMGNAAPKLEMQPLFLVLLWQEK